MNRSKSGPSRRPISPRIGAHEWARLLQECRREGVEPRLFCQRRGLSLKTFQWWRWALASGHRRHLTTPPVPSLAPRGQDASTAVVGFLEVVPPRSPASAPLPNPAGDRPALSGVEVIVRPERELTVRVDREFDPDTFREVVRILGEVDRC